MPDDTPDVKSELEGFVKAQADNLFGLIVNGSVVSTSKHQDYWEYHQRRNDLAKAIVKLGITKFTYAACKSIECSAHVVSECIKCTKNAPAFVGHAFVNKGNSLLAILGFGDKPKEPEPEVKRKRGRPPKQPAMVTQVAPGIRQNHLSDDEPVKHRTFNRAEINKMRTEYNRMVDSGDTMREALVELTKKYKIPYKRAYELVNE